MKRTQTDLDRNAGVLKEDGLPDSFNRLLGTTPEKLTAAKEATMAQKIGPREQALRAQREKAIEPKPAQRRPAPAPAARPPAPEAPAPDKPKETTVKTPVNSKPKPAKKIEKKAPAPAARKAAAAPKSKAKGKTAAAPQNAPANGSATMPRPGSKNEIMLRMALQPDGATEKAICKKLGWQRCRVTLRRVCAKAGATLTSEGTGEDRVYKAVLPAAA